MTFLTISGLSCHFMRQAEGGRLFAKSIPKPPSFTRMPQPALDHPTYGVINSAYRPALPMSDAKRQALGSHDEAELLHTLASEFCLDSSEYLLMQSHFDSLLERSRAPGAPSRDDKYGHNCDVNETILTCLMDQWMLGCDNPESVVLQCELPSDITAEERQAELLYTNAQCRDIYDECHRAAPSSAHGGVSDVLIPDPSPKPGHAESGGNEPTKSTTAPKPDYSLKVEVKEYELLDMRDISEDDKPRMLAAIAKEIQDLVATGVFSVVEMPYNRHAISSRIVLKVKYRADGQYDKHKARLVARGFMERLGSDYFSTFSPMASLTTARSLMALAVHHKMSIKHSDVPQAFVKSLLDTDIWLKLPPGVKLIDDDGKAHKIVKLIRSLYGLRQSPQLFNKELIRFMASQGYVQTIADTCLFTKKTDSGWVCVASEVDDLLVCGSDDAEIERFHVALVDEYDVTDWADIKSFLGINIQYDVEAQYMSLDVETKIDKLFDSHAILKGHLKGKAETPLLEAHMAIPDDAQLKTDVDVYIRDHYASLNGALIYMGITCRPDFTFALSKTSRGMHNPRPKHVAMLRQLLNYAYKHKDMSLSYIGNDPKLFGLLKDVSRSDAALSFSSTSDLQHVQRFTGFADANYANLLDDERKSNTGYVFFMFGCAIAWRSKLQPITAGSTHEAELIACATAALEIVWCRKLLQDIGFAFDLQPVNLRDTSTIRDCLSDDGISITDEQYILDPLWLFNDNLGTTQTINNPDSTSQKSRHIDTRYFKIRQYVQGQMLRVAYIGTDFNIADLFTKGLTLPKFSKFRYYLGMAPKL